MMATSILITFGVLLGSALGSPLSAGTRQDCPPLPDTIENGPGYWVSSWDPIFGFNSGSTYDYARIVGLSGIRFTGSINLISLDLPFTYESSLTIAAVDGYNATGYIDLRPLTFFPSGNFSGTGHFASLYDRLKIRGNARLLVNIISNTVLIQTLTLDELSFAEFCFNFGEDFTIGGSTVDWDELCGDFKDNFDRDWNQFNIRQELTEKFRVALNGVIKYFTLIQMIDILCCWDVFCLP